MKEAVILAFTDQGRRLLKEVERLCADTWQFRNLSEETDKKAALEKVFYQADLILFVSATGIAVRFIAPLIRDKYTDPAVICMDEKGTFVIPLCAGHVGGANLYAKDLAGKTGALPVITTATDINGKFAVDVFAKKNGFLITDRNKAKDISARILKGERLCLFTILPLSGKQPDEIEIVKSPQRADIIIDEKHHQGALTLLVRPLVVGVGCRKGTPEEEILDAVGQALALLGKTKKAVGLMASIDLKKDEKGLLEASKKLHVPFVTYSSEALESIREVSKESAFVKKITGTGNVCERAALLGSGGKMLLPKTAIGRVTVSVAQKKKEGIF